MFHETNMIYLDVNLKKSIILDYKYIEMFLWDWFTGVLKGLGLMNKSGTYLNFNVLK